MAAQIATYRDLPLAEVLDWRIGRLIRTYEAVQRQQYDRFLEQVQGVEMGALRALAAAFGKGQLPDLPSYEEAHGKQTQQQTATLPPFLAKVVEANTGQANAA